MMILKCTIFTIYIICTQHSAPICNLPHSSHLRTLRVVIRKYTTTRINKIVNMCLNVSAYNIFYVHTYIVSSQLLTVSEEDRSMDRKE